MDNAHMQEKICEKCGKGLSFFDKNGSHNFCPTSEFVLGKIVDVCMSCKMEEVIKEWKK